MILRGDFLFFGAIVASTFIDVTAAAPTPVGAIPHIEIVGSKFFNSGNGEQFFMKGIAYQPSRSLQDLESMEETSETKYIDPLADPNICLRDIPYLKDLHVNTVRVYSIDPNKDHEICMNALADAGIYALLDLAEPDTSIARNNPTWDVRIWKRYKDVVDSMHQYPNTLGFFAGNEVTNDRTNTDASPFVKAAIRDVKNYIEDKEYRSIPVGYSSNDDAETRDFLAEYFACGENAADFYGINMYEWCGYSSYGTSGYKERTSEFREYPIPVFFSEFGCNKVRPRPFTEIGALYGSKMTKVWSGGLAYMYFEEENEYGVVRINENGGVEQLEDFNNLRNEFQRVQPRGTNKEEYFSTLTIAQPSECPPADQDTNWRASSKVPPTPDYEKCECLEDSLPCLVLPFQDLSEYEEHFDYVCSQVDCSDITTDGENGIYGSFSDCTAEQKLALQISKLYMLQEATTNQCPITNKNVYFNIKSRNQESNAKKCSQMTEKVLNSKNSKSLKSSKSGADHNKAKTTAIPLSKLGSGSSAQSKNSGVAILFVTIFIASFLL